jgi:hypothetical protein
MESAFAFGGWSTSVSVTPLGTVSIILAINLEQVWAKTSAELASLVRKVTLVCATVYRGEITTHAFMVTFLSLLKIRMSDCIVTFGVTTSGFLVVPWMYSTAL